MLPSINSGASGARANKVIAAEGPGVLPRRIGAISWNARCCPIARGSGRACGRRLGAPGRLDLRAYRRESHRAPDTSSHPRPGVSQRREATLGQTRTPPLKALLIRSPWIDMILDGRKTWELRGSRTTVRGTIALAQAGSKHLVGTARLSDVVGPLPPSKLRRATKLHGLSAADLRRPSRYAKTYAWVLTAVRRLQPPIRYQHPSGAVIWVNVQPRTSRAVRAAGRRHRSPDERPSRQARHRPSRP